MSIRYTTYSLNNFPRLINICEPPYLTGNSVSGLFFGEDTETEFRILDPMYDFPDLTEDSIYTGNGAFTSNTNQLLGFNTFPYVSNGHIIGTSVPQQMMLQGFTRVENESYYDVVQAAPTMSNTVRIVAGEVTDNQWFSRYHSTVRYLSSADQALTLTQESGETVQVPAGYSFVVLSSKVVGCTPAGNATLIPMQTLWLDSCLTSN